MATAADEAGGVPRRHPSGSCLTNAVARKGQASAQRQAAATSVADSRTTCSQALAVAPSVARTPNSRVLARPRTRATPTGRPLARSSLLGRRLLIRPTVQDGYDDGGGVGHEVRDRPS